MASAKPVRKRRSTKRKRSGAVNWGGWWWLLLVLTVGAGLFFSPITAPAKVVVKGARAGDLDGFRKVLSGTETTPWARVEKWRLGYEMRQPSHIRSVVYEPNVFGRATMEVEYEDAVAQVGTEGDLYLGRSGAVFVDKLDEVLPIVQLPANFLNSSACVIGLWPKGGVVKTIDLMKNMLPQMDYRLEVDDRSVLSLTCVDGPKVVLGTSSQLDKKIAALATIVTSEQGTFEKAEEINLTAPERPTVRP